MFYAKYSTLHFPLHSFCRLAVFHFRQSKGGTTGGAGGACVSPSFYRVYNILRHVTHMCTNRGRKVQGSSSKKYFGQMEKKQMLLGDDVITSQSAMSSLIANLLKVTQCSEN